MSSFPARPGRIGGALLAIVLNAGAAAAAEPVPQAPPGEPAPQTEPPPGPPLQSVIQRPGANDAPVQMGVLGAPNTARLGLVSEAEGGLPSTMWHGTNGNTAEALLSNAPRPTRSPALQSLGRRLLLTEADPPAGAGRGSAFLSLRLSRLFELGDLGSVLTLSERVILSAEASAEERVRADTLLMLNREEEACALAADMRRYSGEPYWMMLGAYCAVKAGNIASAELTVSLLRERGAEAPSFYALYDRLVLPERKAEPPGKNKKNAKPPPEPPPPPKGDGTPLSFAMLRAAKLPVFDPKAVEGKPLYLHALALDASGNSTAVRLQAALDAMSFGAFPPRQLEGMVALEGFPPEALADPAGRAGGYPPSLALALLYRSVEFGGTPDLRLQRAIVAYRYASARGYGPVMATLLLPTLKAVAPDEAFAFAAPDLVEVFLATGESTDAYAWYGLIDERRELRGPDSRRVDHLANLLRIAQPSERLTWTPRDVQRQFERATLQGSEAVAERAYEIRILEAMGYVIPPDVAAALPPVPYAAAPALPAFEDAVTGGRVAEAVVQALNAIGPRGPGAAPPAVVLAVIRGLMTLGLEPDARAVGVEAALAPLSVRS